jgi:hypothetical protein
MASRWSDFCWWILRVYASRGIDEIHAEKCCNHWGNIIVWVWLQLADVLNPCFLALWRLCDSNQEFVQSSYEQGFCSAAEKFGYVLPQKLKWPSTAWIIQVDAGKEQPSTDGCSYLGNISAGDLHCWLPKFGMVHNVNMNSCRHWLWSWHTWKCHWTILLDHLTADMMSICLY